MPSPPNITNIPAPRVPLTDERTGLISREWYRFFFNLFNLTGAGENPVSLEDLQQAPDAYAALISFQAALNAAQQTAATQNLVTVDELAVLKQQINALASATNTATLTDELLVLKKQINALESAPAYTPQLHNAAYGSFYDTTTQTAAAINTAYGMTFNSTDLSNGVYIGSPTSRVYVLKNGVYNIQFSAQLDNTSGGSHLIFIWLRVNGTNVSNSASQVRLKSTDGELVAAWNFVKNLQANDYFEIMWSASDTSVAITAQAAAAPVPAIPSVLLTVTDNINAYQD